MLCSHSHVKVQQHYCIVLYALLTYFYVRLCNRWHVNRNYKTKSTTKQTGYCGSDAVTLYKKCSWRWMGGGISRSISPQWNHKAAMHGPWEAPRCSAGIAINQPTTPSKDIKNHHKSPLSSPNHFQRMGMATHKSKSAAPQYLKICLLFWELEQ